MGGKQRATESQASATRQKSAQKLEKARTAQQKVERKVVKLRLRLERAESKLAKRSHRVATLTMRTEAAAMSAQPGTEADSAVIILPDEMRLEPVNIEVPIAPRDGGANTAVQRKAKRNHKH